MNRWVQIVRTCLALGLRSVARVALYRLGVRIGFNPVRRLAVDNVSGPFFGPCALPPTGLLASERWKDSALLFGWAEVGLSGKPPPWHTNMLTGAQVENANAPWWQLPDFDARIDDIKTIWELSRFDWVLANAQRAREGDANSLVRLNDWLSDWVKANPAYNGPNWKCGQEASIRVLHMAFAAQLLGQVATASRGLRNLVRNHLRRIAPTLGYAKGQNNNHGTSEAAALFVGGHWLALANDADGRRWHDAGRRMLEERVAKLVSGDGTFSQYSIIYHRVLLDTLAMAESWRATHGLGPFSAKFYERAKSATEWLRHFVDTETGLAPNIGANDGARLLPLVDCDTRDLRPSLQIAAALFCGTRAFAPHPDVDRSARWLRLDLPANVLQSSGSAIFPEGGFAVLRKDQATLFLRFPMFRYRPSQADALHLDLWRNGTALLRDAGSFSYAADPDTYDYFIGTRSHNTIMFDNRNQMPRLSRFLFTNWLKSGLISGIEQSDGAVAFSAAYSSWQGVTHQRHVSLDERGATITDTISGFNDTATLRWRLPEARWSIKDNAAVGSNFSVLVDSTMDVDQFRLVSGFESTHYLNKTGSIVLEVVVSKSGVLTSRFEW